jgi:hypothetical protein
VIEIKEDDIRPQAIFDHYRNLAQEDAKSYFGASVLRSKVDCPACGARESRFAFQKVGFDYEECIRCETLYVNPRPKSDAFSRYYEDAPSVRYWATHFYKETETVRREMIFKPKAMQVKNILDEFTVGKRIDCLADIGAGYGVFCEEITKLLQPTYPIIAIEPGLALADVCRTRGLTVVPKFLESVLPDDLSKGDGIRIATCFELIEHPHDPLQFLKAAQRMLGKEGLLILTTLNIKGFDLQILWDKSNNIHPPHHINFFSTDSIQTLFERAGFDVLRVETPGRLDVDIVAKQVDQLSDRFLRTLLKSGDQTLKDLQLFLRNHLLSSHMMIVGCSRG